MDLVEVFVTGLITGQHDEIGTSQNNDDGDNNPVDEDASLFSSTSLDELEGRDIFGNLGGRPDIVSGSTAVNQHSENDGEHVDLLDRVAPLPQNPTTEQIKMC